MSADFARRSPAWMVRVAVVAVAVSLALPAVAAGRSFAPAGGPLAVDVRSTGANGSYEDLPGRPLNTASSDELLPGYDQATGPGLHTLRWINPGRNPIWVTLTIGGRKVTTTRVAPGQMRMYD